MLKLFDTQHPAGTEIVKGLNPEDLLAIIRCHPDLWRQRDRLLKFYLRIVKPKVGVVFDLPPDLSQIVCRRIDPAQMRNQIELMLMAAIQYNRIDIVKMLVQVFGLEESFLLRADPHLLHTSEMATGSMLRHLAKPAAEGGMGVNVDGLELETALKGAIESGDNEKTEYILSLMRDLDPEDLDDVSLYLFALAKTGNIRLLQQLLKPRASGGMGVDLGDVH
jgi:hypothetical protein